MWIKVSYLLLKSLSVALSVAMTLLLEPADMSTL